jgi:enamine deaminase RidA (YjgF/YER057c/UK114 family)
MPPQFVQHGSRIETAAIAGQSCQEAFDNAVKVLAAAGATPSDLVNVSSYHL